jgi:ABC-type transport system involved in multi-copper enzyme maturation permease subunit
MIWLTWRQHRRQLLATVLGLLALAAVVLPTGLSMHREYDRLGIADCFRDTPQGVRPLNSSKVCDANWHQFTNQFSTTSSIGILFVFLPVVIGLFWGASVVARELEQGTHRLVWTQGISRRRWGLTKFALVGVVTLVLSAAYAAAVSWWFEPLNAVSNSRFMYLTYDVQGLVPVAYTLFAVGLGILAGTLTRRLAPAMALTLLAFGVVRIAITAFGRPNFLPGKVFTYRVDAGPFNALPLRDWPVYNAVRDPSGKVLQWMSELSCHGRTGPCADLPEGAYNWFLYQPAGRYWTFQWIETGIFVALAVALVLVALRRLPRIA